MYQSQLVSFFFFIFLLLPLLSIGSIAFCPSSTCNNFEISYPFWRLDSYNSSYPQYCGYDGFGINCSDQTKPILELSHESFLVKSINYQTKSLILADIDVNLDKFACPSHNLTLEKLPFEYSEYDKNVTFYFNCTTSFPNFKTVECVTSAAGKKSYYLYEGDHNSEPPEDWYRICDKKVVATVMEHGWISYNGQLGAALRDGFELEWRSAPPCGKCEASDGLCGYNNSTGETLCFKLDPTMWGLRRVECTQHCEIEMLFPKDPRLKCEQTPEFIPHS